MLESLLLVLTLITDSMNVYDKMSAAVYTPKGEEKRVDVELPALKDSQEIDPWRFAGSTRKLS